MSISKNAGRRRLTPTTTVTSSRQHGFRAMSLGSSYRSPNASAGSFHGPSGLTDSEDSDDEYDSPGFSFLAPSGFTGDPFESLTPALSELVSISARYLSPSGPVSLGVMFCGQFREQIQTAKKTARRYRAGLCILQTQRPECLCQAQLSRQRLQRRHERDRSFL